MIFSHRKTGVPTLLLASLVALSGCAAIQGGSTSRMATTSSAEERFPIQVAAEKEAVTFVVAPHIFALHKNDKDKVAVLAENYKRVGHGDIWVIAPTGSANAAASIGAAAEIAKVMVDQGVRPTSIKMNSYLANENDDQAPITVQFKRYHAHTYECGDWSANSAITVTNNASRNFGCSTQSNLAAMVEDPRDLIEPSRIDPSDPSRRATILDKYRAGEKTGTERTNDESGVVTSVVGN